MTIEASPSIGRVIMDVAPGESLVLGAVRIGVISKSGRQARLFIEAPKDVRIERRDGSESGTKHATMRRTEGG